MRLIKSLPAIKTGKGYKCMALFWCPYCKTEVSKPRSAGQKADSCSCMGNRRKKKRNSTEITCLGYGYKKGCMGKFLSEGNWNRFCPSCQAVNNSNDGIGYLVRKAYRCHDRSSHIHTPKI